MARLQSDLQIQLNNNKIPMTFFTGLEKKLELFCVCFCAKQDLFPIMTGSGGEGVGDPKEEKSEEI